MAKKEKKVRIFSALEVADICGVVNQTAINWIRNGFLKAFTTPGGQYRVYLEDLVEFLTSRGMRVPPELSEGVEEEPSWQRILIVDDDETINTLLKKFLLRKLPDCEVRQAFDGFEAGTQLSEWKPGVVLLDINLPGVDGHKLCQRIKAGGGPAAPVVIAITGLDRRVNRGGDHEGRGGRVLLEAARPGQAEGSDRHAGRGTPAQGGGP